ncbi:PhzF family phenazine biosynthesis isomerase [Methylobacterium sp. J-048]|uniref:PhzF family phenazine biosynthesis protein n=1 Tax=Methylobacterium sp. J-048 TaxID=2836635 RepID=UPI001FBAC47B|nr:PhzF family phenazine biosynthesis isomerase [Methylobacterium sp. J-048]MCJ2060171.1 PhzF family phenazine biosynthesis isomerase [Methylobacterium sp. J-048]
MSDVEVEVVRVFTCGGAGGNPCPVVADAGTLDAGAMQDIARRYRHESGFVLPPEDDTHDLRFRFFVPNHEMEMCAHATIGTLWVLARRGRLASAPVRIATVSGTVTGFVQAHDDGSWRVEITQPTGRVVPLASERVDTVCAALGISRDALADLPVHNAATSRVKTLIPIRWPEGLHALAPDPAAVEAACRAIGSTGLYPYAVLDGPGRTFEARQFPRSSGYPEDAATGIAAAALAFGLLHDGTVEPDDRRILIHQGRAMGHLSEISVRIGFAGDRALGCLLGGEVAPEDERGSANEGSFK